MGVALERELDIAMGIAREAGALLMSYAESSNLEASPKGYLDVVTEADTETERLVVEKLREAFPDDAAVGEEGSNTTSKSGRIWYVDPLDGTFNFTKRLPYWCTSIGLVDDDEPQVGVIFDPLHDELFTAVRGSGSSMNGQRIGASEVRDPLQATVQVTVNNDRQVVDRSIKDVDNLARDVTRLRNLGALALELCHLACGRLDAVLQRGSHPWDYAASILIAQEAGATVSGAEGEPFSIFQSDALIASTPELHEALIGLLQA